MRQCKFEPPDSILELTPCLARETLVLASPEHLFPVLNHFPLQLKHVTPKEAHKAVLDLAGIYLQPPEKAALNVGLALHAASPKLAAQEIHKSGREGCEDWVDWHGSIACDVGELNRLVKISATASDLESQPKVRRLQTDHTPPPQPSLNASRWTAIHYADPTLPQFKLLHNALLSLSSDVEYVLRWVRPTIAADGPYLSGYGVALDLKKMDYLAVDDRRRSSYSSHDHPSDNESREDNEEEMLSCVFEAMPFIDAETKERATGGVPLTKEEIQGS